MRFKTAHFSSTAFNTHTHTHISAYTAHLCVLIDSCKWALCLCQDFICFTGISRCNSFNKFHLFFKAVIKEASASKLCLLNQVRSLRRLGGIQVFTQNVGRTSSTDRNSVSVKTKKKLVLGSYFYYSCVVTISEVNKTRAVWIMTFTKRKWMVMSSWCRFSFWFLLIKDHCLWSLFFWSSFCLKINIVSWDGCVVTPLLLTYHFGTFYPPYFIVLMVCCALVSFYPKVVEDF